MFLIPIDGKEQYMPTASLKRGNTTTTYSTGQRKVELSIQAQRITAFSGVSESISSSFFAYPCQKIPFHLVEKFAV